MATTKTRLRLVVVFSLLGLALDGCGGSDAAKPPADTTQGPVNLDGLPIMENMPKTKGSRAKR